MNQALPPPRLVCPTQPPLLRCPTPQHAAPFPLCTQRSYASSWSRCCHEGTRSSRNASPTACPRSMQFSRWVDALQPRLPHPSLPLAVLCVTGEGRCLRRHEASGAVAVPVLACVVSHLASMNQTRRDLAGLLCTPLHTHLNSSLPLSPLTSLQDAWVRQFEEQVDSLPLRPGMRPYALSRALWCRETTEDLWL